MIKLVLASLFKYESENVFVRLSQTFRCAPFGGVSHLGGLSDRALNFLTNHISIQEVIRYR